MYMLQSLTDAALFLPLQTTLDVRHVSKKIKERVSDKTRARILLQLPGNVGTFISILLLYMTVPCWNWRLSRRVFRLHRCLRSTVSLNFCLRRGLYALRKCMNILWIYEAHMSHTLNGSSAMWRFEGSNAIEIRYWITFDFYTILLLYAWWCILAYHSIKDLHSKWWVVLYCPSLVLSQNDE